MAILSTFDHEQRGVSIRFCNSVSEWVYVGFSDGQITNKITSTNHKSFAKMI